MISGIDNIGVATSDLQRSVAFYEKLGFSKAFENERGCLLAAGAARLFVFVAKHGSTFQQLRTFDLSNPPGIDHIAFLVDDVDRAYEEIHARGVEFESVPADQPWGARATMLRDPDGNNIVLIAWLRQ